MLEMQQAHTNYAELFTKVDPRVSGLEKLRTDARNLFLATGFPTTKHEDWKYTNIRPIAEADFRLPAQGHVDVESLPVAAIGDGQNRLVVVNGRLESYSIGAAPQGVIADSAADYMEIAGRYLGKIIALDDTPFIALNTALFEDCILVYVPKGVIVEEPIYVVFAATSADPVITSPRVLIIAEEDSQVTVIESHVGFGDSANLINAVTEVSLGQNAVANHCNLQLGSESAYHITALQTRQERSSNFKTTAVTLGGALVRNNTNSLLDGEGAEATLNGLYIGRNRQHIDNQTRLDHAKPHCPSHELFKGVLDGSSSAAFNGKIIVRQDAQKTDSKQSNMNLLLSDDAVINTKPQLEIWADDVRCTHGATIGRLDENAVFYLRSRGIDEESARMLLIYAFASDVIERIGVEPVIVELEKLVFERFATAEVPDAHEVRAT